MNNEQIWLLTTKYLSKEATEEEIDQLMKLLEQDEEAAALFHKMNLMWNHPKKWSSLHPYDPEQDKRRLFARIRAAEEKSIPLAKHRPSMVSKYLFRGLAAAIVLIAVCTIVFFQQSSRDTSSPEVVWELQANPRGKRTIQTLADGTVVHLNANSRLKYAKTFSGDAREVFLEGEAYFDVVSNPEKPFIVHTPEIATRVLGTSFNVRAYSDEPEVKVSLLEGKVEISNSQSAAARKHFLSPDQQYIFNRKDTTININTNTDLEKAIAWKENRLIIDGESLEEAVKKLEIWYGVSIKIANPAIKDCQWIATFENEPIATVLKVLKYALDVSHEYQGDKIVLKGKGC
ncbi:FecR domain-containing protein [Fulvivirgaceae bacterium BMA12]|uniref:FecR domain-containing protein n=1 Tax=Agaribacillus aureus TaxID=3051825 RepID=A0ABT8LGH5_9BACT|nr:FecR domain-containing protein [Fulvivirgaceae bacterium BMA12]